MLKDLLDEYQVFLFDLDGLLVDTERLHYQAFMKLMKEEGYCLEWTFEDYVRVAHFSSTGLEDRVQALFPELKARGWKEWYSQKKPIFLSLLDQGVPMMLGAADFIEKLSEAKKKMAVVTHSPLALVEQIQLQHPVLAKISLWLTREDYNKPKPDPQSFNLAASRLCNEGEKAVGFEDSPRGVKALIASCCKPVWVGPDDYPGKDSILDDSILHVDSFEDLIRS